ncbi:hypothetical protein CR51_13605 [Caballeronia megalochromosomata]|nr:hypothetical protein CR51_13605 [Caballeronia megalochromosomata]
MKTVGDKLEAFTVTAAKLGFNHNAEDGQFAFEEITNRSLSHLDELVINAAAEQNRVAVLKVLRRLRELDDLRTADERKVLRIEIDFSSTCRRRLAALTK